MISENLTTLNKSEKMLVAIYELDKLKKEKITVEDVAVKLWLLWPSEFCMRGYPEYPNVDIQKYITKLLDNGLVIGGVCNYKLTDKGKEVVEKLKNTPKQKDQKKGDVSAEQPRHVKTEITRIINSKVFKYYLQNENAPLLESDFFEFLGTSARSLSTKNKNIFLTRYNAVIKEVIPYCRENQRRDEYAEKIIRLWDILSRQFGNITKK